MTLRVAGGGTLRVAGGGTVRGHEGGGGGPEPLAVSLSASPSNVQRGGTFTLTATVTGGEPTPTLTFEQLDIVTGTSETTSLITSGSVAAGRESQAFTVGETGDVADDSAIYEDTSDPSRSVYFGTHKGVGGGIAVFDLQGTMLQWRADGELNNVDVRPGVTLGGSPKVVVTASDRTLNALRFYTYDPTTRQLSPAGTHAVGFEPYGCVMGKVDGATYAYVSRDNGGDLDQYRLDDGGSTVTAVKVRDLTTSDQVEGMAVDDDTGYWYVGEENTGIYRYNAAPTGGSTRTTVATVGTHLKADIEGMQVVKVGTEKYLFVSSQGDNSFHIFRLSDHAHVRRFTIAGSGTVDSVSGTDGLDVTAANLGPLYPKGLLVVHDTSNTGSDRSNYKMVDGSHFFTAGSGTTSNEVTLTGTGNTRSGTAPQVDGPLKFKVTADDGVTSKFATVTVTVSETAPLSVSLAVVPQTVSGGGSATWTAEASNAAATPSYTFAQIAGSPLSFSGSGGGSGGGSPIFVGDFDTGDLSQWNTRAVEGGLTVKPAPYGGYHLEVLVRPGDSPSSGERAEVYTHSNGLVFNAEESVTAWSTTFEDPWAYSSGYQIFFQWHDVNATVSIDAPSPPVSYRIRSDGLVLRMRGGTTDDVVQDFVLCPVSLGLRHDFVEEVGRWSATDTGSIKVWHRVDGGPWSVVADLPSIPTSHGGALYPRQGLYRSAFNQSNRLWHDNTVIGRTLADVAGAFPDGSLPGGSGGSEPTGPTRTAVIPNADGTWTLRVTANDGSATAQAQASVVGTYLDPNADPGTDPNEEDPPVAGTYDRQNNFEFGSDEQTVDATMTGPGGDAFDTVTTNTTSGGIGVVDTARAHSGTRSMRIATGATSTSAWLAWNLATATPRVGTWMYFTEAPSGNLFVVQFRGDPGTGSTTVGRVALEPDRQVRVSGAASSALATSTDLFPLNEWFLLSAEFDYGAGTAAAYVYTAGGGSTPVASAEATGVTFDVAAITEVRLGLPIVAANAGPFWIDDAAVDTAQRIVP